MTVKTNNMKLYLYLQTSLFLYLGVQMFFSVFIHIQVQEV